MAVSKKEYLGKVDLIYIANLIKTELAKYVLAVQGKGLSTNDFTNTLKDKLDSLENYDDTELRSLIAAAIDETELEAALADYAPLNNAALTGAPTAPTPSAGDNTTKIATSAFVTTAIANALAQVTSIRFDADESGLGYASLADLQTKHPTGENGVIYLVQNSGSAPNVRDEYFWSGSAYELFGTTAVDLSNYLQDGDVEELTTAEVLAAWQSVFGA